MAIATIISEMTMQDATKFRIVCLTSGTEKDARSNRYYNKCLGFVVWQYDDKTKEWHWINHFDCAHSAFAVIAEYEALTEQS